MTLIYKDIKVKYLKKYMKPCSVHSYETIGSLTKYFLKMKIVIWKTVWQFYLKYRCLSLKLSVFSFTLIDRATEWMNERLHVEEMVRACYGTCAGQDLVFYFYVVPGTYSRLSDLLASCEVIFSCWLILSDPKASVLWINCKEQICKQITSYYNTVFKSKSEYQ